MNSLPLEGKSSPSIKPEDLWLHKSRVISSRWSLKFSNDLELWRSFENSLNTYNLTMLLNISTTIKLVVLAFLSWENFSLKMISMSMISNFTICFMPSGGDATEILILRSFAKIWIPLNLGSMLHIKVNWMKKEQQNLQIGVERKKRSWGGQEFKLKELSINSKKLRGRSRHSFKDSCKLRTKSIWRSWIKKSSNKGISGGLSWRKTEAFGTMWQLEVNSTDRSWSEMSMKDSKISTWTALSWESRKSIMLWQVQLLIESMNLNGQGELYSMKGNIFIDRKSTRKET